jgi:hypothetical protein
MITFVPLTSACMLPKPCAAEDTPEFACQAFFSRITACEQPYSSLKLHTSQIRIQLESPSSCRDTSSRDIRGGDPGTTDPPIQTAHR